MAYLTFDPSRSFDVIPLGRAAIDFNPVDVPNPLQDCHTFKKYLGGSPANIAVGLARLGKKVGFLGKVSGDQFGQFIRDFFSREGIDISHITDAPKGCSLGLTFTELRKPGETSLLMYRTLAADLQLDVADIDAPYIAGSKILLISGTSLAESPSREAALKAMELARKVGTAVVFDIDYRAYNWKNPDEIALFYSLVARNSQMVLGSREEYDLMERLMVDQPSSDEQSAKRWLGFGNRIVVIKHGKEGSTAFTTDGQNFRIKPFPVKAAKATGGGDGYASAFLYGLLEGWDIMDALEFGSACAS
ncbi:MAG: 5-dehydro-2-deoxygluconokinase, partial [Parasulfuritortus sp.]|nr:5-dehydro-2-deoxygluconokinase [Parasulfuritortus sp.]